MGEGGGKEGGPCVGVCLRAHWSRHPPVEANSPVPGLLPPHPQLLGRWEGEGKLPADGSLSAIGTSPLHSQPLLSRQRAWQERNRLYFSASLSHKSFPYPPHWPNMEKKKEELIEAPQPLGGITYSISHEVVGVKWKKRVCFSPD